MLVASVTQVKCGECDEVYSNLAADACPKCGANAGNGKMDVYVVDGVWTPSWGSLKLLYPNKKIEDTLRVTKLYEAFRVYHDERIAVDSF